MPIDVATEIANVQTETTRTTNTVSTKPSLIDIAGLSAPLTPESVAPPSDKQTGSQVTQEQAEDVLRQLHLKTTEVSAPSQQVDKDGDVQAIKEQTDAVRNTLIAERILDPRLVPFAPTGFDLSKEESQKTFIAVATENYMKNLLHDKHLPGISREEAIKAFQQIKLEEARQQQLVKQAKENGQPTPQEITINADGKVVTDEAKKIAGDSIKAPRIEERIPQLKKDGLEPFYATEEMFIKQILSTNPEASYLEIRKQIDDKRDGENRTAIDAALDEFKNVVLTPEEKLLLTSVVNDNRNRNKVIDPNSPELIQQIKIRAAEIAADIAIKKLNENPLHFQYYVTPEARKKIVEEILGGANSIEAVGRHKGRGGNPTIGSTIKDMIKGVFGEITKSRPPSSS